MTDFDLHPDDEIVSAYLDGEATPEEAARVEREPALQARLAVFRTGAAGVGRLPATDTDAREDHLRRAREAQLEGDRPSAPVQDLDEVRRRRRLRTYVLSAAAVVLVLVLGAALVPGWRDDGSPELTATAPTDAADRAPTEGADRAAGEGAPADDVRGLGDAPVQAPGPETDDFAAELGVGVLPHLGSFATRREVDAALVVELPARLGLAALAPGADAPTAELATTPCLGDLFDLDPEIVALVYGASADLAGVPVQVLVFRTDPTSSANSALRRYLVDPTTCQALVGGIGALGS